MCPEAVKKRIAVIGNGVAGNLAAAYFRQRFPTSEIVVIGGENKRRPIVGESTVEVTAHFLHGLGLGEHLEEEQYHKYGLTYYYKVHAGDPACRRYVVHEAPGILRMPAYQLNRATFDDQVRAVNRQSGVVYLPQNVVDVRLGEGGAPHELRLAEDSEGAHEPVAAQWIVDASGRNRVLARKLGLTKPAPRQRSCFWFRLSGFDRAVLRTIIPSKPKHLCFDSYYATHHFFGPGYWVWLIPLRQNGGDDLISVGFTYRPDRVPQEVRALDDYLTVMRRDHPIIADFVETGSVVDTNFYGNYMYEAARYYSRDGWFLIGDAAYPSDPINSAGLSTLSHQIPQVAAMIAKSGEGTLSSDYVEALQSYVTAQLALQDLWGRWYDFIDNPVKMAWVLIAANAAYFHVVLPAYVSGSFLDGRYTRALGRRLPRSRTEQPPEPFPRLLRVVSDRAASGPLDVYIPNMYPTVVNWSLYRADSRARPAYGARYFRVLAALRWTLIKRAGLGVVSLAHLPLIGWDIIRSVFVRFFPGPLFGKTSSDQLSSPWAGDGEFLQFRGSDAKDDRRLQVIESGRDRPEILDVPFSQGESSPATGCGGRPERGNARQQ